MSLLFWNSVVTDLIRNITKNLYDHLQLLVLKCIGNNDTDFRKKIFVS